MEPFRDLKISKYVEYLTCIKRRLHVTSTDNNGWLNVLVYVILIASLQYNIIYNKYV